jgi:rhamnulokinase
MTRTAHIAFDLGAESGRAMLAAFDGRRIELTEIHRFANGPQLVAGRYHWRLLDLWSQMIKGLRACGQHARDNHLEIKSLGVDTWGVDFGLIGQSGQLLGLPLAYRDPRNHEAFEQVVAAVGREKLYDTTGCQLMPFNSLYQLYAQRQSEPSMLKHADRMLLIPDLLHYFFSGVMVNEATDASTTQMIDPRSGDWAKPLLESLGLPTHFLHDTTPPGTVLGKLTESVAQEADVDRCRVILPAAHDTASAIAAVPVVGDKPWAYLSSGTWSLMGVELPEPLITPAGRDAGFTNERGVNDTIRYLKNIAGLWLVQQVRADLDREYDYAELTRLAAEAEPFRTLIDPGHAPFALVGDMRAKIADFAKRTNQPTPETPGQFVRCCLESLALTYRQTLDDVEAITGRSIEVLHIVGGGGRNDLLNQMTADALSRPVVVGPYEATAIGNALVQAMGAGRIGSLSELRAVVRASFDVRTVEPRDAAAFEAHRERFAKLGK